MSTRKKIIAFVVAIIVIISGVFITTASQNNNTTSSTPPLGLSLGLSGTPIETPQDLKELADKVNRGEDVKGVYYMLAFNIDMSMIEDWTPIGTKENPFKGYFDGGNYIISGIGDEKHPSLFGYMEDATLLNIQINSVLDSGGTENQGFFIKAKNCNFTNCFVHFATKNLMHFASTLITPNTDWHDLSLTSFNISQTAEFLGIAELVNTGQDDFDGDTIYLGDINLDASIIGEVWQGIGTEADPFKGTIIGGTLRNLTILRPGESYVAPFAHTEGATLNGVKMINVNILGGQVVGGLVGEMINTQVVDCMASGSVVGTYTVGGLIASINDNAVLTAQSSVRWCYTTTNIVGTVGVGGIIGKYAGIGPYLGVGTLDTASPPIPPTSEVQYCFATGNIVGTIAAGGILGILETHEPTYTYPPFLFDFAPPTIAEVAYSGTLRGIGKVGGIVGNDDCGNYGAGTIFNSYVSGTIHTHSDGGLFIGTGGGTVQCYSSGSIVAPSTAHDSGGGEFVNRSSGWSGTSDAIITVGNSIYPSDNYRNQDLSRPDAFRRPLSSEEDNYSLGDRGLIYFEDFPLLDMDSTVSPFGPSKFNDARLDVASKGLTDHNPVFSGGYFPTLMEFEKPGRPAFQEFSKITTTATYMYMPTTVYVNGTTVEDIFENEVELPEISGIKWSINGLPPGEDYKITDPTITGEVNTIGVNTSTTPNTFSVKGPLVETEEIVLSALVPSIDGFELKYTIRFEDKTVRPVLSSVTDTLFANLADISPTTVRVYHNLTKNLLTFGFTEPVSFKTGLGGDKTKSFVTLVEYSNNEFAAPTTVHRNVVEAEIVNNTVLRLSFPDGFFKAEKGYKLEFTDALLGDTLVDDKGNLWEQDYYFKTDVNLAPEITFESNPNNYALAQAPSVTSGDKKTQTISMAEDDSRFYSIYDGVNGKDTVFVDPHNANVIITSPNGQNAGGKSKYPALNIAGANTNLYRIPGTYEIEYQVPDPLDESILSNKIVRTYLVDGELTLTQGGGSLKNMDEKLSKKDITALRAKYPTVPLKETVHAYLVDKYLKTPGSNMLEAYKYNTQGEKEDKDIIFETSIVTDVALENGLQGVLSFTVEGGDVYYFAIEIEGLAPDKDIVIDSGRASYVVDRDRYVVNNTYLKGKARAYYNARVVSRSNPTQTLNDRLVYDFSKVDSFNFDVPQEVTIRLADTSEFDILGIPAPEKTVQITIMQKLQYVHKEQKWTDANQDRDGYWAGKLETVRRMEDDHELLADLSFYYGLEAPRDFFLVLGNKDNNKVKFTLPNNYQLIFDAGSIDTTLVPNDPLVYNFNVEDMYSYYVERDAGGEAVQQFYTSGSHNIPGKVKLLVPISEELPTQGLTLYTINKTTGKYELEQKINASNISGTNYVFELSSFKGEYVITAANLDGKVSSLNMD